jgi:hypothetical protein
VSSTRMLGSVHYECAQTTAFKFAYLPHFVTLGTKSPSVSVHGNLFGYGSIDLLRHSVVVMIGS